MLKKMCSCISLRQVEVEYISAKKDYEHFWLYENFFLEGKGPLKKEKLPCSNELFRMVRKLVRVKYA